MNTCSIFRSASSPPLAAFTCRLSQFGPLRCRSSSNLGFRSPIDRNCLLGHGGVRSYSVQSLVETVMEELHALRKRKGIRGSVKYVLISFLCVVSSNIYVWTQTNTHGFVIRVCVHLFACMCIEEAFGNQVHGKYNILWCNEKIESINKAITKRTQIRANIQSDYERREHNQ